MCLRGRIRAVQRYDVYVHQHLVLLLSIIQAVRMLFIYGRIFIMYNVDWLICNSGMTKY